VIATLRELAATLAADVTVDAFVAALGGDAVDLSGNVVVDEPALDGVARANVVRALTGEAPAHVTLDLLTPVEEGALTAAFGRPTEVTPERTGAPGRFLYDVELPDGPFTIALLASVDDDGGARRITLRRDTSLR
jgi:hypothetical protein